MSSLPDVVRECVAGEVIAAYKPRSVSSVYVICEPPCEQKCGGVNIVTEEEFLGDVQAATLGEIVASTLLAPPEMLYGDESLVEEAMTTYHYRVLLEEHKRLRKMLGRLSERAIVSVVYHLFARASRIQRFYPWAGHGLVEALAKEPRKLVALSARILEEAGCKPQGTVAGLCTSSSISRRGWKLSTARLTRLWPLVRPGGSDHPLLKDPLLLVRLDKARLRTKLMRFEDQAYRVASIARALETIRRGIGGTVTIHYSRFKSIIVKRYLTPATAKWIIAAGAALPIYPYRLTPRSRLEAEYIAVSSMLDLGLPVPQPILVDPRGLKAAYEYIEGTPLHQIISKDPVPPAMASAGALLAEVHKKGWVVGDANPSNFIVGRERVYLVDLEQAMQASSLRYRAWDLAVLVYYSFLFNPREPGKRAAMVARAYIEAGGERDVVKEAAKTVYTVPFVAIAPVTVLDKARKALLHSV